MIPNYPYFGLPNYMRYMNPNPYPQHKSNISNIKNSYSVNTNQYNPHLQRAEFNNYSNQTKSSTPKINNFSNFNNRTIDSFGNISSNNKSSKSGFNAQGSQKKYPDSTAEASQYSYSPMFNLLGLNIYFDDILIVCILFFLYSEHVDDPFLFIVLVLLLMS